jgi:hypothetical protein
LLVALSISLALLGCAAGTAGPGGPRQLTFQFRNDSSEEAHILITRLSDNAMVGSPTAIPPQARDPVTIAVPEGDDWALYVEPSLSDMGPMLFGNEVSGCSGGIQLAIRVDSEGNATRSFTARSC